MKSEFRRRGLISALPVSLLFARGTNAQGARIAAVGDSIANGIALANPGVQDCATSGIGLTGNSRVTAWRHTEEMLPGALAICSMGANDVSKLAGRRGVRDYVTGELSPWLLAIRQKAYRVIVLEISGQSYEPWSGATKALVPALNTAIRDFCSQNGMIYSHTVGRAEQAADGLHWTGRGSRQLLRNALADAGITPPNPPPLPRP